MMQMSRLLVLLLLAAVLCGTASGRLRSPPRTRGLKDSALIGRAGKGPPENPPPLHDGPPMKVAGPTDRTSSIDGNHVVWSGDEGSSSKGDGKDGGKTKGSDKTKGVKSNKNKVSRQDAPQAKANAQDKGGQKAMDSSDVVADKKQGGGNKAKGGSSAGDSRDERAGKGGGNADNSYWNSGDGQDDYEEPTDEPEEDKDGPVPWSGPAPAPVPAPSPEYPSELGQPQVQFVLSRFGVQFNLGGTGTAGLPTTMNFKDLEDATINYLKEALRMFYDADDDIDFDSVMIAATGRRIGGDGFSPFIDFEASAAFQADSKVIPTGAEIGAMVSHALSGQNQATYLFALAQNLSDDNPFLTTSSVNVFIPDSNADNRVSSRSGSIVAAACAGVFTLCVAGYVGYRIKEENQNDVDGKLKFTGGMTVAGDTCGLSTISPSSLHHMGPHSVTESYTDDHSSVTSPTMADVSGGRTPQVKYQKDASGNPEESKSERLPGRSAPRAMVPKFKNASPLSSREIQNYFKAKYNCASPAKYQVVDEADDTLQETSSAEVDYDDIPRTEAGPSGLEMPPLDHMSVEPGQVLEGQLLPVDEEMDSQVEDTSPADPPEIIDDMSQIQSEQDSASAASFDEETIDSDEDGSVEEFVDEFEMDVISESGSNASEVDIYVNDATSPDVNMSPLSYAPSGEEKLERPHMEELDNVSFGKASDSNSVESLD